MKQFILFTIVVFSAIKAAGQNVGIGISTPMERLHVSGGSILTDRAYAASTVNIPASTIAFSTGVNAVSQIRITDNASPTANGNLTYGATAIEGQYLWITNTDAQSVPFTSTVPTTIIPAGTTMGFVYTGGAWRTVSANVATNNWTLTGNTGTIDGTNFIGTTDNIPFSMRVNNQLSGRIGTAGDGSTFLGYQAGLNDDLSSNDNTFIGFQAGNGTTTGQNNVSLGYAAMRDNTTGSSNTAVGYWALESNISSNFNTAVGYWSLRANTTGGTNTAAGAQALELNTTGSNNSAFGYQSIRNNTSGSNNVGLGYQCLFNNQTGSRNVGLGYQNLVTNVAGDEGTAVGYSSQNFVNNTASTYTNTNVSLGAFSLRGTFTPANNIGLNNVAIGHSALLSFRNANNNIAIGYQAMNDPVATDANRNIAIGTEALMNNSFQDDNIAIGFNSLRNHDFGTPGSTNNIAIGNNVLSNNLPTSATDGKNNTAVGHNAMLNNTTGYENSVLGYTALNSNTTGFGNSAIGYASLNTNTTGNFNTGMGYNAQTGTANSNTIAIAGNGNLAIGASNMVRIGNAAMTSIGGQVGWTVVSDERTKKNVRSNVPGLAFINLLNPVTYNYDLNKSNETQGLEDKSSYPEKYDIEKIRFSGFLAQEVEKSAQSLGYEFSGVDKANTANGGLYGIRHSDFIAPIVKAIQELSKQNEQLKAENKILMDKLQELEQKLFKIQNQIKSKN